MASASSIPFALLPDLDPSGPSSDPNPSTSNHRRIALQSPADLIYLMNNATRAAHQKLDMHLPSLQLPEPPTNAATSTTATSTTATTTTATSATTTSATLTPEQSKRAVQSELNTFLSSTFDLAKPSLSINGIDAETIDWTAAAPDEYEPLDTGLAAHVAQLHARIEALNERLAQRRRDAAREAAAEVMKGYAESVANGDREMERVAGAAREGNGEGLAGLSVPFAGREEEVRRTWEGALQGVLRMEGLGKEREKGKGKGEEDLAVVLERARRAVEVVRWMEEEEEGGDKK